MADRAESPEWFPVRSDRRLLLQPITSTVEIDHVIDKLKTSFLFKLFGIYQLLNSFLQFMNIGYYISTTLC